MNSDELLEALDVAQEEYMDALKSGDQLRIDAAAGQLQELEYEADLLFGDL